MDKEQKSLFDEQEKSVKENTNSSEKKSYFIPMNRVNLCTVLASGVISSSSKYNEYDDDIQKLSPDNLILTKDTFNFLKAEEFIQSSTFGILIEVDVRNIDLKNLYIFNDGSFTNTSAIEGDFLFCSESILVQDIECIHFRTDEDLEDFKIRGFDNVPVDVASYKISPNLFSEQKNIEILKQLRELESSINFDKNEYQKADAYAGAITCFLNFIGSDLQDFNFFKNFTSALLKNSILPMYENGIVNKLDQDLFKITLTKMIDAKLSLGWQPKILLNDIASAIETEQYDDKDQDIFKKWLNASLEILENKRTVSTLTDDHFVIGRALLLLLMRPTPEDLRRSISSSLEPGKKVITIASIFIGARYGLETLSNDFKNNNNQIYNFSSLIKSLILDKKQENLKDNDLSVEEKQTESFGSKIKLLFKSNIIIEKENEGSVELNKVILLAKSSSKKITLSPDREFNRLKYTYEFSNGRSQRVYIKEGKPTPQGGITLRFYSPCLDLKKKSNMILLRKEAMNILIHSNDPERYCRFAIDEEIGQLIVMRDQIDFHGHPEELEFLRHVAEVADKFEEKFGFDQY